MLPKALEKLVFLYKVTVLSAELIYTINFLYGKTSSRPRDKTDLQPVPVEAPGPITAQTSVPGTEVLAIGRMNALRQGGKRKLLQLWDLPT